MNLRMLKIFRDVHIYRYNLKYENTTYIYIHILKKGNLFEYIYPYAKSVETCFDPLNQEFRIADVLVKPLHFYRNGNAVS